MNDASALEVSVKEVRLAQPGAQLAESSRFGESLRSHFVPKGRIDQFVAGCEMRCSFIFFVPCRVLSYVVR